MSLEFHYDGHEICIEHPHDYDSWMAGLNSYLNEFASNNYGSEFERCDDIGKEMVQKLAEAVGKALVEFRAESEKAKVDATPAPEWEHTLSWKLSEAWRDPFAHDGPHDEALYGREFTKLYETLDAEMQDFDGPVVDIDELFDKIRDFASERMQELDGSTIYDALGNAKLRLMYVPGYQSGQSLDSYDVCLSSIATEKMPGKGEQALLSLLRVSLPDFMDHFGFDFSNESLIDSWLDRMIDPTTTPEGRDCAPLFSNLAQPAGDLFSNAESEPYVLPCWVGDLEVRDIRKLDPLKPVAVTGGWIALHNHASGAGGIMKLKEEEVILQGDWYLRNEAGYTLENTYGLTGQSFRAEAKRSADPVKAPSASRADRHDEFSPS